MSKSSSTSLLDLIVAIAAVIGIVVIVAKVCEWLFGDQHSTPDLRHVLLNKDRQIERLAGDNMRLASINADLVEENAYLRKLLQWWLLTKEFCAQFAARLAVECAKTLLGLAFKFA